MNGPVFTIERVTTGTSRDAGRLLAAQLTEHDMPSSEASAQRALAGLVRDEKLGFALVARTTEVVGLAVCAFTWTVEHGGRVMWLDELYVLPSLRGGGIGRALLLRAMEEGEQAGCVAVDLEVDREHTRAARLYEREGFESLPRVRYSRRLSSRGDSP